jgi:hypothetical protein
MFTIVLINMPFTTCNEGALTDRDNDRVEGWIFGQVDALANSDLQYTGFARC